MSKGIYRRISCIFCKKNFEFYQDSKKVKCKHCRAVFMSNENNTIYCIDYSVDGRRFREKVGANKKVAQNALIKRKTEIAENKFLDIKKQSKIKLYDLIDQYVELYLKPNRPTWWKSEKHNLRHIRNYFGNCYLKDIITLKVEKFRIHRLKEVSKTSVNKNVGCLRAMMNKAIEWGLFEGKNPVSGIRSYKSDNKRTRFLEKEDIVTFLSNCEGHLKDIIEFAINTGMRQGEIFHLKWRDVDLKNSMITILKTKNNEIRHIPINQAVESVLLRVRKDPDSPYVFPSKKGRPFDNIKRSFKTALDKSDIKNFRFHDLRHTFASQLVMNGVDLFTVKELLGHKDIKMTMRYSHLSCDHKKQAVGALDRLSATPVSQASGRQYLSSHKSIGYSKIPLAD
ncbi:MAG: tyrosine-type recombinase/integrase [Candidatus Zapsychrus exili]|nr:tyrosine-type recombinase/integrase [Candidatus Zapsychrus exili]